MVVEELPHVSQNRANVGHPAELSQVNFAGVGLLLVTAHPVTYPALVEFPTLRVRSGWGPQLAFVNVQRFVAGAFVCSSTQELTVLYQSWEFCGLRTQWPSSGK